MRSPPTPASVREQTLRWRVARVGPLSAMRVAGAYACCVVGVTAICGFLLVLAASATGFTANLDKLAESLSGSKDLGPLGRRLAEVAAVGSGAFVVTATLAAGVLAVLCNNWARLGGALQIVVAPARTPTASRRRRRG